MPSFPPRSARTRAEVAALFRVLAEPMRLQLLEELRGGPRQFGDLAEAVGGALSWTSKQLKALHEAGLVARRREATKVWFSLSDEVPEELVALVAQLRNLEPGEPKTAQPQQALLFDF